jgi:hypothetical protein
VRQINFSLALNRPERSFGAIIDFNIAWYFAAVFVGLLSSPALAQERAIVVKAIQTVPLASDSSEAAYVAETISVPSKGRDQFVECLHERARMRWIALRQEGVLADVSVFETTKVRLPNTEIAEWNFLILSHLRVGVPLEAFFAKATQVPHFSSARKCTMEGGVEVRRVEVLRPTPKSSYPRVTLQDDLQARMKKVSFIIEYIAVDETPVALAQYRESMARNMGAAMGLMIPEETFFEFKALEQESVKYTQENTPRWNQIHIRGFYPNKGASPVESPEALRRVNPSGGSSAFFASLDKIRTKPREDEARQLFDLAVR